MTPRGIAVLDLGYSHSKILLFDRQLSLLGEHSVPSRHVSDGLYPALDPEPFVALAMRALPELDAEMPVDAIVPSAHGSAVALVDGQGMLALPVMDYAAMPPDDVLRAYERIAPPFSEVFAPVLPGALTLGRQLFWQESCFPEAFARTRAIMPWAQYAAFRLGGRMASEITALGAQTQLLDVDARRFSSLARQRGWDRLFAPRARAFDRLGRWRHAERLRGRGELCAGIHDSNANYLRYLATGKANFTLLSTGTWIIGFTPGIDLSTIDPRRDVVSNSDIFGRPVASCRFMGGKELEILADGAPPQAADIETAAALVARGTMALPAFTDSGGPIPDRGHQGRIEGPPPASGGERASLASLYCALMSWQSLTAVGGDSEIIVDGPFASNPVYLRVLAALLGGRAVSASAALQGTAIGAALLALVGDDGRLPHHPAELRAVTPAAIEGLDDYAARWLALAEG